MTRQELLLLRPGAFVRVIKKPWGVWLDKLFGKVFEVEQIERNGHWDVETNQRNAPAAICPVPPGLATGRHETAKYFCFTASDIEVA